MARRLSTVPFLNQAESRLLLDVRSPGEFADGHVPGAISFPLFSDEERSIVGTLYKQEGKDPAFLKGLEFTGPKMADYVRRAKEMSPEAKIAMYCWRGGMRSGSMAWLLEAAGMDVLLLEGGYKAFRHAVLHDAPLPEKMVVIGGFTGSRKSEILRCFPLLGHTILDLEALASHRGSSFGNIALPPQPRQEQFENLVFMALLKHNPAMVLWLEDESKAIGKLRIPDSLHAAMRSSRIYFTEKTHEERLQHITASYGKESTDELKEAMQRIGKRLGGLALKEAMEFLELGNIRAAAAISLRYYDKTYRFGLEQRDPKLVRRLNCAGLSDMEIADLLISQEKYG
jgi:tRNA 2-selenouridine synthase